MHPILSDARATLCYGFCWLLAGVGLAVALGHPGGLVDRLPLTLPLGLITGFVLLSARYVSRALPYRQRRPLRLVQRFGGAALFAGLLIAFVAVAWNALLLQLRAPAVPGLPAWPFLVGGVLLYLLSLAVHEGLFALENVRAAAARTAEMQSLAQQAELQMLRTQVNPHFLFNCLNSISALTTLDPAGARAMTLELADYFRSTLALSAHRSIRLDQEIAQCQHFLAIEQRRFGDRLRCELEIDPAAGAAQVAPMCLQPLLENALKHGTGALRIAVSRQGPWLHLTVTNPLGESRRRPGSNGIGLVNLRQRLALMYDTRARLVWQRQEDRFTVQMTVPYREGNPTDGQ